MKGNNQRYLDLLILAVIVLPILGCGSDTVQTAETAKEEKAASVIYFASDSSSRSRSYALPTRTSLTHALGSGATVLWSSNDYIWAEDNNGTFQRSAAGSFNPSMTSGTFAFSSGLFSNGCQVNYTGNSSSGTQVTIASSQTQSVPNDFSHAGVSGDCGVATALGDGTHFNFQLDHKASYLCLLPRSSNGYINRSTLEKIEIISEDDIAGTYSLASDGTLTLVSGGSKSITLTTGSGFKLTNTATDMSMNASYVVIAPGTHVLAIRYWLKNTTDHPSGTEIKGTITKYVTLNCQAGKIYDVTANLVPADYSERKFYMWDAQYDYWQTGVQSVLVGATGSGYATSSSDIRWYNTGSSAAVNSAASYPNVNQTLWYADRGDWHSDFDELWIWKGHLWKGGAWVLKRANIGGFNENTAPDGTDYRMTLIYPYLSYPILKQTRPAASQLSRYFFLPYIGSYDDGTYVKNGFDTYGFYWTSNPSVGFSSDAYYIDFYSNRLYVANSRRSKGAATMMFE